uniref:Activator of 90 kDa heat shock protein ATPase homolog 1-like n=1 Tax=Phallusia mammillata TaxID=59560 RepID=A0A6F9D6X1_9ASCI|nr:activator of 90 kDa heat shock protein ATPase homolog 1-like [Phallusia mammillata]
MAKWGEGDPRWIVEERADAHNVNNWHWREKDASDWSKKKINQLLKGLKIEDNNIGSCYISEITSCEGEASVSNRKKKIICIYDFQLKAKWKGSLQNSKITYTGMLEVPNLSEENSGDEVDVTVSFGKDDQKCDELKDLMRKKGIPILQEKFDEFAKSLRNECASTIQLPTNEENQNNKAKSVCNDNKINSAAPSTNKQINATAGVKINTKKLIMSESFMTSVDELYKTLTLKDRIQAWSRSPVQQDAASGETFTLFDGNVSGEFTSLARDSKIAMRWRFKSWPDAHYSNVTINLTQNSDGTKLELEQTGVPESSIEATKNGWKNYYWRSIKMTFGYGANIL